MVNGASDLLIGGNGVVGGDYISFKDLLTNPKSATQAAEPP